MKTSVGLYFLVWLACVPIESGLASEACNEPCDLPEPWVREEIATIILNRLSSPASIFTDIDSKPSSVKLQLLLWGYIKGTNGIEVALGSLDIDELLELDDDHINGLLWIIASSGKRLGQIELKSEHIQFLDSWSNRYVKEQPRKMFLYAMVLSRITGRETLSRMELEMLDSNISDPDVLFHIAGKLLNEDRSQEAHRILIQAFENGSLRALYGLGELEASQFDACSERGAFYIQLFAEAWAG